METFEIQIQELLSRKIAVEASNLEEAVSKASEMYHREEIVLDYDDFSNLEIGPSYRFNEKDSLTLDIIDYLYHEEKLHFEESDEPDDHIFLKIEQLKSLIELSLHK